MLRPSVLQQLIKELRQDSPVPSEKNDPTCHAILFLDERACDLTAEECHLLFQSTDTAEEFCEILDASTIRLELHKITLDSEVLDLLRSRLNRVHATSEDEE